MESAPMKPLQPLSDTQAQRDERRIPIDRVGVRALRYPMQIRDKARETQHTIATTTLTVDLPHQFKGTHMSRFVEVLNEFGPELHVDNIHTILRELTARLHSVSAHVDFEFPFFLTKRAPVTRAQGLMDYTARFSATLEKGVVDFIVTVIVPVTTLCPCSKAISVHGAHNQRGQVTFAVRFSKPIWIEDLIRPRRGKRFERTFTASSSARTKKLSRNVLMRTLCSSKTSSRNIAARSNAVPEITWYRVEAENFESIHNHNAYALIEHRKE